LKERKFVSFVFDFSLDFDAKSYLERVSYKFLSCTSLLEALGELFRGDLSLGLKSKLPFELFCRIGLLSLFMFMLIKRFLFSTVSSSSSGAEIISIGV
jgi:hypothetical protein